MNVYVESNFVLELALEQEKSESCSEIIQIAQDQRLQLFVPAFSLAEPHQAIALKDKARKRFSADLKSHLGDLGRSRPHRDLPATADTLSETLITRAQLDRVGLKRIISTLLETASVIPLDSALVSFGSQMENDYGLTGQDAIVLASVVSHLETTRPIDSCFLNRNSKDFDDPDIRERLESLDCELFATFGGALEYLKSHLQQWWPSGVLV
jgi:hypothetical protein